MQNAEIKDKVRAFILKEFLPGEDPAQLTDSVALMSGRILDSLATLKLVVFLEETFGIECAAHEIGAASLDTIEMIAQYVESKRE